MKNSNRVLEAIENYGINSSNARRIYLSACKAYPQEAQEAKKVLESIALGTIKEWSGDAERAMELIQDGEKYTA